MKQEMDTLFKGTLSYVEEIKQADLESKYNRLKAAHGYGTILIKNRLELNLKPGQIRKYLWYSSEVLDTPVNFLNKCMLFAAKCPNFEEFWETYKNEKKLSINRVVNVLLRNVPSKLEIWKQKMIAEKACLFCGNSLQGKPFDAKFCSVKCRRKFHKRKTKASA